MPLAMIRAIRFFILSSLFLSLTACQGSSDLVINQILPADGVTPGSIATLIGVGFKPESDEIWLGETLLSSEEIQEDTSTEISVIIPEETVPGDYFIQINSKDGETAKSGISILPLTVTAVGKGDVAEDNSVGQESDTGSDKEVLETPPPALVTCNWDGVQFGASEKIVYKSENDHSDKFVNLIWSSFGNCVPDKAVLYFEDGRFSEFTGIAAQSGSHQVILSKTEQFRLELRHKGEAVRELHLQISVENVEENFSVSVTAVNNVGVPVDGVTLTPEKNYLDSNVITLQYEFDSWFDKICLVYPHDEEDSSAQVKVKSGVRLASRLIRILLMGEAHAGIQLVKKDLTFSNNHWRELVPGILGNEKCFTAADAVIDADGKVAGSVTFELTKDETITWYVKKGGVRYLENSKYLSFHITEPSVSHSLILSHGGSGPDLEQSLEFEGGARFAVVTNAADELNARINATSPRVDNAATSAMNRFERRIELPGRAWEHQRMIETLSLPKSPTCSIGTGSNADLQGVCRNDDNSINWDLVNKVKEKFSNTNQVLYVYEFDSHNISGTLELKSKVYNPKFLSIGFGHQNKLFFASMEDEDIQPPNFDNICASEMKAQIFGPEEAQVDGKIYGLKDMEVRLHHLSGQIQKTPLYENADVVEGAWNVNVNANYTGKQPWIKFSGKNFLGVAYSKSCAYGTIQDWPIEVRLKEKVSDNTSAAGKEKVTFEAKIIGQDGPRPYKGINIEQVSGQNCNKTGSNSTTIDWTQTNPKRSFTFKNYGMGCYKFKAKIKRLDDDEVSKSFVKIGGQNKWTTINGNSSTIKMMPAPTLSWEMTHDVCDLSQSDPCDKWLENDCGAYDRVDAAYVVIRYEGEHIKKIIDDCGRSWNIQPSSDGEKVLHQITMDKPRNAEDDKTCDVRYKDADGSTHYFGSYHTGYCHPGSNPDTIWY